MPGRWLGLTGVAALALVGGGCGTFTNITTAAGTIVTGNVAAGGGDGINAKATG